MSASNIVLFKFCPPLRRQKIRKTHTASKSLVEPTSGQIQWPILSSQITWSINSIWHHHDSISIHCYHLISKTHTPWLLSYLSVPYFSIFLASSPHPTTTLPLNVGVDHSQTMCVILHTLSLCFKHQPHCFKHHLDASDFHRWLSSLKCRPSMSNCWLGIST